MKAIDMLARKSMTKKAYKEQAKKQRVFVPFNTGTRTMKSKKDYSRATKISESEWL